MMAIYFHSILLFASSILNNIHHIDVTSSAPVSAPDVAIFRSARITVLPSVMIDQRGG
jgi:hypothetical protein